jgi:hypothetical protein
MYPWRVDGSSFDPTGCQRHGRRCGAGGGAAISLLFIVPLAAGWGSEAGAGSRFPRATPLLAARVAEACGNRTHHPRLSPRATGFEVQEAHQHPFASARHGRRGPAIDQLERGARPPAACDRAGARVEPVPDREPSAVGFHKPGTLPDAARRRPRSHLHGSGHAAWCKGVQRPVRPSAGAPGVAATKKCLTIKKSMCYISTTRARGDLVRAHPWSAAMCDHLGGDGGRRGGAAVLSCDRELP